MKQLYEDLWQNERYSSGMLNTHAYLLTRPNGNILFYNTGSSKDLEKIAELGGSKYNFLTHRDEVGASLKRIKDKFGSLLGTSKLEAPFARKHAPVDIEFELEDTRFEDIQILFTPGHTDGSLCYLYNSPHGRTYLFSGDTFFMWNGKWSTFVMPKANGTNQDMLSSLEKLRDLRPDVILSSGFVGDISYSELSEKEWIAAIESNIEKHRNTLK